MSLQNRDSTEQACPCGKLSASKKPLAFAACCARYLSDLQNTPAPDAESLMRSRYSAFVMKRSDYLLATWHASARPAEVSTGDDTKWLGLEVRRHTVTDADHAQVAFVARYRIAGRGARIHELSRFVRDAGRWYYLGGDLR